MLHDVVLYKVRDTVSAKEIAPFQRTPDIFWDADNKAAGNDQLKHTIAIFGNNSKTSMKHTDSWRKRAHIAENLIGLQAINGNGPTTEAGLAAIVPVEQQYPFDMCKVCLILQALCRSVTYVQDLTALMKSQFRPAAEACTTQLCSR